MLNKIITSVILAICFSAVALAATTQIELTTQVKGVLPTANGGTGSATSAITPTTVVATVSVTSPIMTATSRLGLGVTTAQSGVGQAACWTASSVLGYCSNTPTSGTCTCN
jgi:hypothetical protein